MATTDARTGFRLPWTTDQKQTDGDSTSSGADGESTTDATTDAPTSETRSEADAQAARDTHAADDRSAFEAPAVPAATTTSPAAPKKQNKFLVELTKAMQAAAESAREESVNRFAADAKSFVEQIHARSAEESADLRRRADDDVASIRDWSKAEIARIREETEHRITDRKGRLEREVEQHAALIEHEIERVQGRVADFEGEMARFFERLLGEDDPSRFAAMAENLPEPPSFDVDVALAEAATLTLPERVTVVQEPAVHESPAAEAPAEEPREQPAVEDPEAAFAAIQAAAEAAAVTDSADAETSPGATEAEAFQAGATETGATETTEAGATETSATETTEAGEEDPRVAALGLNPDSAAAAEAEAFAIDPAAAEAEEIPVIADDALAARLAGLVPNSDGDGPGASAETQSTQVVVVGLVSVASIASFKRHLGRLPGVQGVGVSSGPDGEFVFAVTHGPEVVLSEAVATLPGFQPRVTASGDGVVNVTAHDPESDS
jgi:hypothetical protein